MQRDFTDGHELSNAISRRDAGASKELRLSGHDDSPIVQNIGFHSSRTVTSDRTATESRDVGRQDESMERFAADNAVKHRCRDMPAVGDHAAGQSIVCKLRPEDIVMTRDQSRAAVAQMRPQRGTCIDCRSNFSGRGRRMPNRNTSSRLHNLLRDINRVWHFRRKRHDAYQISGDLLPSAEF